MTPPALEQGAVVLVQDGRPTYESYRGLADRSRQQPIDAATRFQLASVSKEFTAVAVLKLADRGRLSLADPVGEWIEDTPASWSAIRLQHLLSHTAGLGHWPDYPEIDLYRRADLRRLLRIFMSKPPIAEPGRAFHYSSPGFVLLACVVERASGQPYRQFVQTELLSPLGLENTFLGNPGGRSQLAHGYEAARAVPSFELDTVGMGAGDVWCTAMDLARWTLGFRRLLATPSARAMLSPQVAIPANDTRHQFAEVHYGYGCYLATSGGQPVVYHIGNNRGFNAINALLPADEQSLVMLTNDETVEVVRIAQDTLGSR